MMPEYMSFTHHSGSYFHIMSVFPERRLAGRSSDDGGTSPEGVRPVQSHDRVHELSDFIHYVCLSGKTRAEQHRNGQALEAGSCDRQV